jgi:hypothetical protein
LIAARGSVPKDPPRPQQAFLERVVITSADQPVADGHEHEGHEELG